MKHIVMFQLKKELHPTIRRQVMQQFKHGIEQLPETIPCIRAIHVGLNVNPDEQWDICLDATFDTIDDVRLYAAHPDHVAVAAALKPFVAARGCVDYDESDTECKP